MPVYFCIWCPLGHLCTKKGKVLCKFTDEQKTRSFLFNHLVASPYHSMPEEEARQTAESAEVQEEVWDDDDADLVVKGEEEEDATVQSPQDDEEEELQDQQAVGVKFARFGEPGDKGGNKGKGKWKGKGKGKGKGKTFLSKDDIAGAVAQGVQLALSSASSASSSSTVLATIARQPQAEKNIKLRRSSLQSAIDHMRRGEASARQAARISSAAADAFNAEAGSMAEARAHLQDILALGAEPDIVP